MGILRIFGDSVGIPGILRDSMGILGILEDSRDFGDSVGIPGILRDSMGILGILIAFAFGFSRFLSYDSLGDFQRFLVLIFKVLLRGFV